MERKIEEEKILGDEELATVSGGADCLTLVKLRIDAENRGDDGFEAFFQGALNGSGCSCPTAKRYGGQHA